MTCYFDFGSMMLGYTLQKSKNIITRSEIVYFPEHFFYLFYDIKHMEMLSIIRRYVRALIFILYVQIHFIFVMSKYLHLTCF